MSGEAHGWNSAAVLAAEIARLCEQRRVLASALRGLIETIESEQRMRGLADYTEAFNRAYAHGRAALRNAED